MKKVIFLLILVMGSSIALSQERFRVVVHYLFPEFVPGVVEMKDGIKERAMLNYHRLTEEMVFINQGRKMAITQEEMARIDTIRIDNRRFFVYEGRFVELLHQGGFALFADHRGRVRLPGRAAGYGTTSYTAVSSSYLKLAFPTEVYNLQLPEGLTPESFTFYYLKKEGETHHLTTLAQLRRIYRDKLDRLRAYQRENVVDFDKPEAVLGLIRYLEYE